MNGLPNIPTLPDRNETRTPPPKPSWYETFCKEAEEQFHREFNKYHDKLMERYLESRKNGLKSLGMDDPYKQ